MNTNNFYIISGGPGVGKTTLINELSGNGFITVEEEARKIIREQMRIDGTGLPWKNKALYAQLMLDASVQSFEKTKEENSFEITFFDRGIPDTICYMHMEHLQVSKETLDVIHQCRYNEKVFILPPWKEIYQTDAERKQSWKEALFTFEKMKSVYQLYGYQVIEVPKAPVEERAQFIIEHIRKTV